MSGDTSGRTAGPFIKNGRDLYEQDRSIQWFILISLFLITVGFFIYVSVAVNNYAWEHTYFKNPGMPGTLTSARFSFPWIMMMLSVLAVGLGILFIFFMVIFRDNYGCHMIWFIFYFLTFALLIFVLVVFTGQYANCNDANEPNNICNDRRWCCVHFVNPANQCPNVAPCAGVTAADLGANEDFLWVFWTLVAITALELIFFIVLIVYWFSPAPPLTARERAEKEEEAADEAYYREGEEADEDDVVKDAATPLGAGLLGWATNSLPKRTGLRERKFK